MEGRASRPSAGRGRSALHIQVLGSASCLNGFSYQQARGCAVRISALSGAEIRAWSHWKPGARVTKSKQLITPRIGEEHGGSATTRRTNRRLVAAGCGGFGEEARRASRRIGRGGSPGDGGRRWCSGGRSSSRREDGIHRGSQGSGREQDQRD